MKVIQVGMGGMGNTWLRTVLEAPEIEFAGFVEVNETIARQQAARYQLERLPVFQSLPQALAAVPAGGVINVTPPAFHREVSLTALKAGLPVLSEKPLAGSMADARDVVQTATSTGVLHMVAQNYRYHPPLQTLQRLLASGELGPVAAVTVDFFKGPQFGGFRDEMPYPLIVDMAIHHFDLLRFLLDSDPVSVFGRSWNPPWSWYKGDASAAVTLEFANRVVATYNASWCSTARETSWNANWRFECERGVLSLEDDRVFIQRHHNELEDMGSYRRFKTGKVTEVEPVAMPREGQAYLLHEFYEAVTQGKIPATTCQDNIKSLGIVFDCLASFETGQPVRSAAAFAG